MDASRPVAPEGIQRMMTAMHHRGPDGQGMHMDGPVGLGHCRLSIIDLSTGNQPMTNEDGTIWLVFNGEIYNYRELRVELQARGHVFRSQSDTEVIIHLYEEQGEAGVSELRGMFAFALWDARRARLFLARDRIGIKPLYYVQTDNMFLFASEVKALLTDPDCPRAADAAAIRRFLVHQYLPGAATAFRGIRRLPPGYCATLAGGRVTERQYWELSFTPAPDIGSLDEAADQLHALLGQTVRDHMISDVPVGILLSGGVDSSAVVSHAVQETHQAVQTFTIGFAGDQVVDERHYARLAARQFGTNHRETTITASEFWDFLPHYVWHMEDPVCEPPAVALYYVSKLARETVTVLLSGEGGDEAFAGYPNYPNVLRLEALKRLLGPLRALAGGLGRGLAQACGDERLRRYAFGMTRAPGDYYFSRAASPTLPFNAQARDWFTADFLRETAVAGAGDVTRALFAGVRGEHLLHQLLFVDTKTWLPDDLLVKADKITMANSLELRVPLLDHKILEFAASLPPVFKVNGRETKRVLKRAFARILPAEILQRRKAGFPVPFSGWLQRELHERAREVLMDRRTRDRGIFTPRGIETLLDRHRRDGRYGKELYCALVLEIWHRLFMDGSAATASGPEGRTIAMRPAA